MKAVNIHTPQTHAHAHTHTYKMIDLIRRIWRLLVLQCVTNVKGLWLCDVMHCGPLLCSTTPNHAVFRGGENATLCVSGPPVSAQIQTL